MLLTDSKFRDFFEGESKIIPDFYLQIVAKDLGSLRKWLPEKAIYHNPNAYLEKSRQSL
jgi:hypothetical protein